MIKLNVTTILILITFILEQFNYVLAFKNTFTMSLQQEERAEIDLSYYFNQITPDLMQVKQQDVSQKHLQKSISNEQELPQYYLEQPFHISLLDNYIPELWKECDYKTGQLRISTNQVQIGCLYYQYGDFVLEVQIISLESSNEISFNTYQTTINFEMVFTNQYSVSIENTHKNEGIITISQVESEVQYLNVFYYILSDNNQIEIQQQTILNTYIKSMKIYAFDTKIFMVAYQDNQLFSLFELISNPTEQVQLREIDSYEITNSTTILYTSPQIVENQSQYLILLMYSLDKSVKMFNYFVFGLGKQDQNRYTLQFRQIVTKDPILKFGYYQGVSYYFINGISSNQYQLYRTYSYLFDNTATFDIIPISYQLLSNKDIREVIQITDDFIVLKYFGSTSFVLLSIEKQKIISQYTFTLGYYDKIKQIIIFFDKIYIQYSDTFQYKYATLLVSEPALVIINPQNLVYQTQYNLALPTYYNKTQDELTIQIENIIEDPIINNKSIKQYYSFDQNQAIINLEEFIDGSDFQISISEIKTTNNILSNIKLQSLDNFVSSQMLGIPRDYQIQSIKCVRFDYLFISYTDKKNQYFANLFFLYGNLPDQVLIQPIYSNYVAILGPVKDIDNNGVFTTDQSFQTEFITFNLFMMNNQFSFTFHQVEIPCNSMINSFSFTSDQQYNVIVQCGSILAKYSLFLNSKKSLVKSRDILNIKSQDFIDKQSTYEIISNLLYIITQDKIIIFDYIQNSYIKVLQAPQVPLCTIDIRLLFQQSLFLICEDSKNQISAVQYGFELNDININQIYYQRTLNNQDCLFQKESLLQKTIVRKGTQEFLSVECTKGNQTFTQIYRINNVYSHNQLFKTTTLCTSKLMLFTFDYLVCFDGPSNNIQVAYFSLYHKMIIEYRLINNYSSKVENISFNINVLKDSVNQVIDYSATFQRNYNTTQNIVNYDSQVIKNMNTYFNTSYLQCRSSAYRDLSFQFSDETLLTGNRLGWEVNNYNIDYYMIQPYYQDGYAFYFLGKIQAIYQDNYLEINNQKFLQNSRIDYLLEDLGSIQTQTDDDFLNKTLTFYTFEYRYSITQQQLKLNYRKYDNLLLSVSVNYICDYRPRPYSDVFAVKQILTVQGLGTIAFILNQEQFTPNMIDLSCDGQITIDPMYHFDDYQAINISYEEQFQKYLLFTSFGDLLYFNNYTNTTFQKLSLNKVLVARGQSINTESYLQSAIQLQSNRYLLAYEGNIFYQIEFILDEDKLLMSERINIFFGDNQLKFSFFAAQQNQTTIFIYQSNNDDKMYFALYKHNEDDQSSSSNYLEISSLSNLSYSSSGLLNQQIISTDKDKFQFSKYLNNYSKEIYILKINPYYSIRSYQSNIILTPNYYKQLPITISSCYTESSSTNDHSSIHNFINIIIQLLLLLAFIF